MQTQIQCPQCRASVTADVHQIVDVDKVPQMKQMLMGGALNVAQCQNCGWQGQVASPMVYHESAHDLLLHFIPMELNIPFEEQERLMGGLLRQVVGSVPMEQRRAYLLQPQKMMRFQTLLEKVLMTEGITPEMIARQKRQGELLRTLITADNDVVDVLLTERLDDIDETFVGMVQQTVQQAAQAQQTDALIRLTNLQARLMCETPAGKRLEEKQLALRAMNADASENEGITPEILLKHVLLNRDDDEIVDALVETSGALSYEFFSLLSAEIESETEAGETKGAEQLTTIRTRLLDVYDAMRKESEAMMVQLIGVVDALAAAPDKREAIQQNAGHVNQLFLQVLEMEHNKARENGDLARSSALAEVRGILDQMMQQTMPPEIQFVMDLMQAPSKEAAEAMLDANPDKSGPEFMQILQQIMQEIDGSGAEDMKERLQVVMAMVAARTIQ